MKVRAMKTLYNSNRISLEGVKKAVVDGVITKEHYTEITGKKYK